MVTDMGKVRLALLLAPCCGLGQPAIAQSVPATARPALDLDAGPSSESGPDPLTPPAVNGGPLLAPGAAEALPERGSAGETDPIVLAVRERLAALPVPREAGERDDLEAIKTFYAAREQPVWLNKAELSARGQQAILEIGRADDWGLKASAFDLPKPVTPTATTEALAESEIKLSLAVLAYARQ